MKCLAIKNNTGTYDRHNVSEEVCQYVLQLESYIKHPHASKLREVYKDRFGKPEPDLMKVIKDDLRFFRHICATCLHCPPKKCKVQLRIDTLAQVIKNAEQLHGEPIEIDQEVDCSPKEG